MCVICFKFIFVYTEYNLCVCVVSRNPLKMFARGDSFGDSVEVATKSEKMV